MLADRTGKLQRYVMERAVNSLLGGGARAGQLAGSWFPDQRLNLGVKVQSPNHWIGREFPKSS